MRRAGLWGPRAEGRSDAVPTATDVEPRCIDRGSRWLYGGRKGAPRQRQERGPASPRGAREGVVLRKMSLVRTPRGHVSGWDKGSRTPRGLGRVSKHALAESARAPPVRDHAAADGIRACRWNGRTAAAPARSATGQLRR